jgi:galactokinase
MLMSSSLESIASGALPEGTAVCLGKAPARVELLGNHTDYNGGLVLAAAIDRYTVVAGRASADSVVTIHSIDFRDRDMFRLGSIEPTEPGSWSRYVRGVVWALQERFGPLVTGFEAAVAGDVPLGAGLSSSASLQAAVALFLLHAGVVPGQTGELDDAKRMELAHILRRSENAFVGVNSGLLDQFSVLFGRAGMALRLDCLTLEYERLSLGNPPPAIVVCDSKTSRRLADGKYNERYDECQRVVSFFRERKGAEHVRLLRDVTLDELRAEWSKLDHVGRLRARHVLTENDRVQKGAEALRAGDIERFGQLVCASHASSRDDFENSSSSLDALIEAAEVAPGFLGGKLSGAGWAGCTVNLVRAVDADGFADSVMRAYTARTGIAPKVHICHAADGAHGSTV